MSVGPSEIVVIILIVLLLFGSRRLADLGKGIGEGISGFKRGIAGESPNDSTPASKTKEAPKIEVPPRIAVEADSAPAARSENHTPVVEADSAPAARSENHAPMVDKSGETEPSKPTDA
jgi:sec-independent protein translocase protein TatA